MAAKSRRRLAPFSLPSPAVGLPNVIIWNGDLELPLRIILGANHTRRFAYALTCGSRDVVDHYQGHVSTFLPSPQEYPQIFHRAV
jgi:hypothetical protein